MKDPVRQAHKLIRPYEIRSGQGFHLNHFDPADTGGLSDEEEATESLAHGIKQLSHYQERLYAQNRWALLLIFQAMDAAGKDGAIRHVMSGINPQGCQVHSLKAPSAEDLGHDYLWRTTKALPERGQIGIFNRSYYEETLIARVHPELLAKENIPDRLKTKKIWKQRFEDINAHELHLSREGIVVRKFFLHISKAEQGRRFLARLDESKKNWKFSTSDLSEREYWGRYMEAYQDTIRHTAVEHAPWYVIPADKKWFTWLAVAGVIIATLDQMDLHYPQPSDDQKKRLDEARIKLESEKASEGLSSWPGKCSTRTMKPLARTNSAFLMPGAVCMLVVSTWQSQIYGQNGAPPTASAREGSAQNPTKLTVRGAGISKLELSAADLAQMPRSSVLLKEHGESAQYEGVALHEILVRSGVPSGDKLRGKALTTYVLLHARDGYQVVFALAETDPEISTNVILVADRVNGGPINGDHGPLRLVVPQDKKPARSVRMLESVDVVQLGR